MAVGSVVVTIPARQGKALHLKKGQFIRIINTHGSQVVDTWAFKEDDLNELMSMEHTRSAILCLLPKVSYPAGQACPRYPITLLHAAIITHRLVTFLSQTSGGLS